MAQKYTWKTGDNLFDLAEQYGTTSTAILEANPGLRQPLPGIVLTIPGAITQTTTTTLAEDPKGPKTPEQFVTQPPPEPVLPDWFPTIPTVPPLPGVPDPKGPYTSDLPTPAPGATVLPSVQQPVLQSPFAVGPASTLPQSLYPDLRPEAQIYPQQGRPLADYLGTFPTVSPAGRPLSDYLTQQQPPDWRIQPTTTTGQRIQTWVNALLGRTEPPRLQSPFPAGPASTLGGAPAAGGYSTGTVVGPSGLQPMVQGEREPILRALIERGMSPDEALLAIKRGMGNVVPQGPFAPPTTGPPGGPIFPMGEGGWPDIGGPEPIRSSIIEYYLDNGLLPLIFFREDIARLGITEAELIAAGYVKDQFGDWVRGEMTPAEAEMVAEEGGGGGGYYPRRGGGGGGGQARAGGGGGGYPYPVYPSSRGAPYPQSFVQRGQRGISPTGRNVRPARMGMINWRIG